MLKQPYDFAIDWTPVFALVVFDKCFTRVFSRVSCLAPGPKPNGPEMHEWCGKYWPIYVVIDAKINHCLHGCFVPVCQNRQKKVRLLKCLIGASFGDNRLRLPCTVGCIVHCIRSIMIYDFHNNCALLSVFICLSECMFMVFKVFL